MRAVSVISVLLVRAPSPSLPLGGSHGHLLANVDLRQHKKKVFWVCLLVTKRGGIDC